MEKTFITGVVKDCCKDAENLELLPDEGKEGLTVKRCKICGCRHRRMVAEPGMLGLKFIRIPKPKEAI